MSFFTLQASFLFILSVLFLPHTGLAQHPVAGVVHDAVTETPISDVTVQVDGGFDAVVTNAEGKFVLTVPRLPVTIRISLIGYFSQEFLIESASGFQAVKLVPAVFDMDPVIVTEHESVEDIVRRVIERKKEWRSRLLSLTAEGFARLTVENDSDILFLSEGIADITWTPKEKWKTYVKYHRRSSNRFFDEDMDDVKTLDQLGGDAATFNLYDDTIYMLGHRLMGPAHPEALKYYRFEMMGQRLLDKRIVYDIGVTPKSKLHTGIAGRISVIAGDYAMIEADLKPSAAVLFPPPVQEFVLNATQQFARFGEGFWLPVGLQMQGSLKAGIVGLSFPRMNMRLVTRFSNYRVTGRSRDFPDSLTAVRRPSPSPLPVFTPPAERTLLAKNDSLVQRSLIPLTEREERAYAQIDSNKTFIQAFEPKGFIASALKKSGAFDDDRPNGERDGRPSLSGRRRQGDGSRNVPIVEPYFTYFLRYNRVEGGHGTISARFWFPKSNLTLNTSAGYGIETRRWSYGGGMAWRFGPRNRYGVSAQYLRDTATRFLSLYPQKWTAIASLVGQDDYFDYYYNEHLHIDLNMRAGKNGRWSLTGGFRMEKHRPLAKKTDYALFGIDRVQRPNPAIQAGDLRSVAIEAYWGRAPQAFRSRAYRHIMLSAEFSHPRLAGSDFSFARYSASYSRRFPTWLKRRMLPLTLDLRVTGGVSHGTLPLQRYGSVDGSLGPGSSMGVFKTLWNRPYEGEHHAAIFWEHNFRTTPFELFGWNALVKRAIGMSVFGGHGRTWLSATTRNRLALQGVVPNTPNRYHHEAGLSINGLLYMFRLDFTARIDRPGFYAGLGLGPGFVW
ncbi:MAG: carboxypeptidase-like regulatory domain-containing protein [candidate division Zixibacteria bacterium]|nr:carboxypeptidase-like regulatory domain-containing protein [candidate division Zixibacteria bacterium]